MQKKIHHTVAINGLYGRNNMMTGNSTSIVKPGTGTSKRV